MAGAEQRCEALYFECFFVVFFLSEVVCLLMLGSTGRGDSSREKPSKLCHGY